ncbi:MAG: sugar-binding protein [Bacillota bacterium]
MRKKLSIVLMLALMLSLLSINAFAQDEDYTFAFVSNGPYTFWNYAQAGIAEAEEEYGVEVEVFSPPSGDVQEQRRFIETMMARGIDGLGISVLDPSNMTPFINEIAAQIPVITTDSDAPDSDRIAYLGVSNYNAGRLAGEKIKEALPDGGNIVISTGSLDAANANGRINGIIDELKGNPEEYDGEEIDAGEVECGDWTILDIRSDSGDESRAKSNAENAITRFGDDLDLMFGVWNYNAPAILSAVEDAGKEGEIDIIGFDENRETLEGIEDGSIYGSVVQNPYEYGRRTVEILYKIAEDEEVDIPEDEIIEIPARFITEENVAEFQEELDEYLEKAEDVDEVDESELE